MIAELGESIRRQFHKGHGSKDFAYKGPMDWETIAVHRFSPKTVMFSHRLSKIRSPGRE